MKRISVEIDENTMSELNAIIKKGMRTVREVTHARILLLAHSGRRSNEIAEILNVDADTVLRVKKRFLEGGIKKALHDDPKAGQPKKYGDKETAEIIALACSSPPGGRKRWSVRLITEEMKKRKGFEGINRESVRLILKKNGTKPWKRRMWCIRTIDKEYRKRMYDILDLYGRKNRQIHVIAIDEKPKQVVSDKRKTIPMKPGSPERYDYEYVRKGTRNIFVAVEPRAGKRITKVTKRRTKKDFAMFVKLVLDRYPKTKMICSS